MSRQTNAKPEPIPVRTHQEMIEREEESQRRLASTLKFAAVLVEKLDRDELDDFIEAVFQEWLDPEELVKLMHGEIWRINERDEQEGYR